MALNTCDCNCKRNKHQDRADELGVPIIPPNTPHGPGPDPTVAICGECGLELKRVMGYVCTNHNCPCGMGPITC